MKKLKAMEVLVMHFTIGKPENNVLRQSFWSDRYYIDPFKVLEGLIARDIVFLNSDISTTIYNFRIPELKNILRDNGLKVGGNKEVLINRILENKNDIDFDKYDFERIYDTTDEYQSLLQSTKFIKDYINDFALTVTEVYEYYLNNPELNNFELKVNLLKDKIKDSLEKDKNGVFESQVYQISHLLERLSSYYIDENDIKNGFYYYNGSNLHKILIRLEDMVRMAEYDVQTSYDIDQILHHYDRKKYVTAMSLNQYTIDELEKDSNSIINIFNVSATYKQMAVDTLIYIIKKEIGIDDGSTLTLTPYINKESNNIINEKKSKKKKRKFLGLF